MPIPHELWDRAISNLVLFNLSSADLGGILYLNCREDALRSLRGNLMRLRLLCLTGLSFLFLVARAQSPSGNSSLSLQLKSGAFMPSANAQQWFDSMRMAKAHGPVQVILQFSHLPTTSQKVELQAKGIFLAEYLPENAFTALIENPSIAMDAAALNMRAVVPIKWEWKLDERIRNRSSLKSSVKLKVLVSFFKSISTQEIEHLLKTHAAVVTDKKFAIKKVFEIEVADNELMALAKEAMVIFVSPAAQVQPLNFDARSSSGAKLLGASSSGYNLDGSGVTLGIGDNVAGIYHIDVRDRVTNFNPDGPTMHGVHTTTTMAGKGIMDPHTVGMAPAAKVLGHLYDIVWAQTAYMYSAYNMTITNNSYAAIQGDCNNAGLYDQYAQLLDDYQKTYPFVQNVFASGNDGLNQCGSFPVSYATVTGGYQPAKNILTVGALAKDNVIWPKSSRGPVKDGRLKPEIVAYGFRIYSGDINDNYGHSNGTSMSCPVVTGNLALIQQRYHQLHAGQNIPSDLLKALAMNGATDVGNPGPDFLHGYGLLNTYRSIQMLDNSHYAIDSLSNGGQKNISISVPPNTSKLKVMLYWHDDPANPLAASTLVNNLDLEVAEPNATLHHPLVLDPSPANVANVAVEGIDSKNNSEQVVINNPSAGNYSVTVKGTNIPGGKQHYVVVYDFVPTGIKIKNPVAGVPLPAGDSIYLYWDASEEANGFTLEFSDNGGSSWNVLSNNIPSTQRHYFWHSPNISSEQCRVRISRNNSPQQDVTGNFVMNPAPQIQLSANQCPGYMAIEWTAVPNATGYEVLRKIGDDLQPVDTVTALNYVFSGVGTDSLQFAGVRPLINGVRGWRSFSVKRIPNDGNCTGNISDNDLKIDRIISPSSGRMFTGTALKASDTLRVQVRNLDDVAVSNWRVSYSLNGGAWTVQNMSTSIPAGALATVNFSGLNLAAPGTYKIAVAVENLSAPDPVSANDTLLKFVRQLSNDPVDLNSGFFDDFESLPQFNILTDSIGISPNDHWDYSATTDSGRVRSFVSEDVLIGGDRSVSLDLQLNREGNENYFTGTFNLQAYDTATTEARVEFDYKLHGQPKYEDGNAVWVRKGTNAPWLLLYQIDTTVTPGVVNNSGSLSLTHVLQQGGQDFSSDIQVRIGQHDTSVIAMNEYGNGITMDNFRLYSVKNDVQLLSIASPLKFNCGIDSAALSVKIYNSDNLPQDTVLLFYRLDNGPIVTDTLFSLAAKDTVLFTFPQKLYVAAVGQHSVDVWLSANGDSYLANDSLMKYNFRNQPSIAAFPYLEDFEAGDGNWYAGGFNSSWEYGTPNSLRQKTAASGTKAWATNLDGNYNDNEQSYLYSPCFEIAGLSNPMLSFSLSTHIENCGSTLCDAAFVEYSADGLNWTKLGNKGEGYNWYDDLNVWNDTNTRWRVASIPLPKNIPSLKLRFTLQSDAGAAWDGIAVDDIHIFDAQYPVYDGGNTQVTEQVTANNLSFITSGGAVLAALKTSSGPGSVSVDIYRHASPLNPILRLYSLTRNYVIHTTQPLTDSAELRLFITDAEVLQLINDKSCDTCIRAQDAYRLGVLQYHDEDKKFENGSLTDNVNGTYTLMPYQQVKWVPYDKGYYAQFTVKSFSEFWFTNSLPGRAKSKLSVYPNPVFDDQLSVVWSAAPGDDLRMLIYDAVGRMVFDATTTASDFDNKTVFQLPDLVAGVYTVRCQQKDEVSTFKIVVED